MARSNRGSPVALAPVSSFSPKAVELFLRGLAPLHLFGQSIFQLVHTPLPLSADSPTLSESEEEPEDRNEDEGGECEPLCGSDDLSHVWRVRR